MVAQYRPGEVAPAPCRERAGSGGSDGDGRPPDRRTLAVVTAAAVLVGVLLAAVPSSPSPPAEGESPAIQAGLRTIVIDPGHGGQEVGALGPGGLRESEITLDIALQLRELIFRRIGINVHLTRDSDVDLSLDQRTERANNWGGALLLSIHANAYRGQAVRGPETFFLSASATDELARGVAGSENAVAASDEPPAVPELDRPGEESLDLILWDLAQTAHLRESSLVAELVQAELNDLWQIRDRGVKQAPFRVLKGAMMPAILVEVGFLSNPEDARRLGDPRFRGRIAEALFRAVQRYREQYAVLVGAGPAP